MLSTLASKAQQSKHKTLIMSIQKTDSHCCESVLSGTRKIYILIRFLPSQHRQHKADHKDGSGAKHDGEVAVQRTAHEAPCGVIGKQWAETHPRDDQQTYYHGGDGTASTHLTLEQGQEEQT